MDLAKEHEGKHYAQKNRCTGIHAAVESEWGCNVESTVLCIQHHCSDVDRDGYRKEERHQPKVLQEICSAMVHPLFLLLFTDLAGQDFSEFDESLRREVAHVLELL